MKLTFVWYANGFSCEKELLKVSVKQFIFAIIFISKKTFKGV